MSLCSDLRSSAPRGARQCRVVALVREDGWRGGVEAIPEEQVWARPGAMELVLGGSGLTLRDGCLLLHGRLSEPRIEVALTLRPVALPLRWLGADLEGGKLSWVVVPALRASGQVLVEGRRHRLDDAPAYHDHNWGFWSWGADFAWQWGFALPEEVGANWSLIFSRLTNRARTREMDLKLSLWRDGILQRLFNEREVEVRPSGFLRVRHASRFPPVMSPLVPGEGTDAPRRLDVVGRSRDERLSLRFDAEDVAQILVPNESDLGVTLINETVGRMEVEGRIRGESIQLRGRGVFEFLTFE
jgi:hypothetical protein